MLFGPLFLILWIGGADKSWAKNGFPTTDTIPQKADMTSAKTCLDCHGTLVEKKIKHTTETEKGCADCHKSTADQHPGAKVSLLNKMPDLCLSCHEEQKDLITSSPFVHEALKDSNSCVACHSPHSSDVKKLLVAKRKDLCLSCHNKSVVTKTKTTINFEKLMKNSKVLHPPFEDCQKTCHNPHASQDSRLLDLPFPLTSYSVAVADSFALCWECHGSDMIEKPTTKGATEFRNGETNLHYTHVHGEKGRSCMLCHNPHATDNDHLIRDKVKFGKWDFRMNYAPTDSGGSCAPACHTEKKYTR